MPFGFLMTEILRRKEEGKLSKMIVVRLKTIVVIFGAILALCYLFQR